MSKYINKFFIMPKEMFRLNRGGSIALRNKAARRVGAYDLVTELGKVKPKALNPETCAGMCMFPATMAQINRVPLAPNGASMHPNTRTQNSLVRRYRRSDLVVYAIPKGEILSRLEFNNG